MMCLSHMVVKRLSGDYSCEAFLESSYEKVLRCSSTYGGQYMNDHEIFDATFDYHYALRKLNELGDKDTDREAVLIDIKCKAVDILDKYSDSIRYFAKTRRHITEW